MQKNPCHVSSIRSVCGIKAPVIGVFLLISLVLDQPVLAISLDSSSAPVKAAPVVAPVAAEIAPTVEVPKPEITTQAPPVKEISAGLQLPIGISIDSEIAPGVIIPGLDENIKPQLIGPTVTPPLADLKTDPVIVSELESSALSEEQSAQLQELDELLTNDQIDPEEYNFKKDVILGKISPLDNISPLNIIGVDPKSQTLGKYISPEVSVVDGALNYTYPIPVPPGRNGLSPNLTLVYDSNNTAQNSVIGIGWSLSIPYIQRVNKRGTDKMYADEFFFSSLDGELISQGGGLFMPRIENGSFLKYEYNYSENSWTVTSKDGTQYKFGSSAASRQDDASAPARVFSWFLEKISDTNGNTISYSYFKEQGQIYPKNISYNQTGIFTVDFVYMPRKYRDTSYAPVFKVWTSFRLASIDVKISGALVSKYLIRAEDNQVKSIQAIGYQNNQASSTPPVVFKNFTDEGKKTLKYEAGFSLPTDPATDQVLVLDYNNFAYYGNSFKDINGDGLLDIVRWTTGKPNGYASVISGNQIFLNTGSGFQLQTDFTLPTDPATGKVFTLDYKSCQPGQSASAYYGSLFIDINGDGLLDIVRWAAGKPNGYFNPTYLSGNQVYINTGKSFVLDENFRLPTDTSGNVLVLDCNNVDYYGNSFKDINGDGRPDIIRWESRKTRGYSSLLSGNEVYINTGQGFEFSDSFTNSLPTSPTNGKVLTLDYKFSNNTTNFYGNSFIDINGDGLLDIVRWTGGKPNGYYSAPLNNSGNQVYINDGLRFILNSNFLLPTAPDGKVFALDYNYGPASTYYGNSFKDINGDGLLDVVRWVTNKPNGYFNPNYTSGNQVFLNTGRGFVFDSGYYLPTDPFSGNVVVLDYMVNGFYGNSFQDINGDGLLDVVRWDVKQGNGYSSLTSGNQVFINTGENFVLNSDFTWPTAPNGKVLALEYKIPNGLYNKYGISFNDIDGDGLLDVVRWDASQKNGPPAGETSGNQVLRGVIGQKSIKRIINRYGGEDEFSFKGIRQFTDSQKIGLNKNLPKDYRPLVVVSHATNDQSGTGNVGQTTYEYSGAAYFNFYNKPFDKKIVGFEKVVRQLPSGAVITTKYHQGNGRSGNEPEDSFTQIGKPYEETVADKIGNLYSRARFKYQVQNLGGLANSVQLVSRLQQNYDGQSTHRDTAENYAYDQYGNLSQKISFGEVFGQDDGDFLDSGQDKLIEYNYYARNQAKYLMGLPSQTLLFNQDGKKLREARIYYDNLALGEINVGNPTKTENWKVGAAYVNNKKTYNAYGLVATSTDALGNATAYIYDEHNLYPVQIKNPLNQINRFSYNYLTGQPRQIVDENNFTYQLDFDAFGRIIRQWIPDPNFDNPDAPLVLKTEFTYINEPLNTSIKERDYFDNTNFTETYRYFDGFNRLLQERQSAEKSGEFNVRDLVYNKIGALEKESVKYVSFGSAKSIPTTTGQLYINYVYDFLGRITGVFNNIGSSKTYYHQWQTTVTDARGKNKDYYKDAYGNLIKVEEHNGSQTYTTSYQWDGNRRLLKITDALGNIRNFTYDGLGQRLSAEDLHIPGANAPTWNYVYDNAGNLVQTLNPKAEIVNYGYDVLNRLLKEYTTDPINAEFLYGYDGGLISCKNTIGRLCIVFTNNQTNVRYRYNSTGAIAEESQYIDGLEYKTSYTYDRQGNILLITYPDNSQVRYSYNKAGLLERIERRSVGGTFSDVVSRFDYSPMGQITSQIGANGTLSLTNTYDTSSLYRLVNKKVVNNEPLALQNLTYTYDQNNNIIKVVDTSSSNTAKTVIYTYDDLNRLIMASADNVAAGQPYNQFFTYDAVGNILANSRSLYTYSGTSGNPHAVTKIYNPLSHVQNFSYDANGNLINKTTTAITAMLKAKVRPNGLPTKAGFSVGNLYDIGSGNSPVVLTPYQLTELLPNTTYNYQVVANNPEGSLDTDGSSSITLSTASGPAPSILSAWVSNVTDEYVEFGGQVSPNGHATDAWYELTGGPQAGQYMFTHLKDCNTPIELSAQGVGRLATSTTYQVRVVAKNEMGTTASSWMSFHTYNTPEPPEKLPRMPILTSATVNPEAPLYLLDNVNYFWNYKNQLSGVSNSTSNNNYWYNYTGRRVKATVYEKKTNQTYTKHYPNKLYEVSKGGAAANQEKEYIYAGGTLVATVKKVGSTYTPTYVYNDNLGGTSVIADQAGKIVQTVDYYPYGQERICGGSQHLDNGDLSCAADRKYIGEYYDMDTALNYLNARYYDSFTGRFISQDPVYLSIGNQAEVERRTGQSYGTLLADPQSLNSYSYARNNPLKYSDASGEYWETIFDLISLGLSLYDYNKDPSLFNGVFVAADSVGLVTPVPAVFGYVKNAAKVAKIGKYFSKVATKADDLVKLGELFIKNINFKFAGRAWSAGEAENDVASLVGHYVKHGAEVGAKDVDDYYRMANDFIDSKSYTHLWQEGADTVYYNSNNKIISIINGNGQISSYYKVTDQQKLNRIEATIQSMNK